MIPALLHRLRVAPLRHGADCPWCRQPQEWHTNKRWDACLRAYGVFRHSLGCRSGLPSLLDERRRIFAETQMLVELARDLLIRREPEAAVVRIVASFIRTDPMAPDTDGAVGLAESTVEIARMRLRHVLDGMDYLDDDDTT